nr:pentapeptide repeat-containing protein [Amycolatopsis panacis]
MREVCQLEWSRRGHSDVDIREQETEVDGRQLLYLRVSYVDGTFTDHAYVGILDGNVDLTALQRFHEIFEEDYGSHGSRDLVYRGPTPQAEILKKSQELRLQVRSFENYQALLWNFNGYIRTQSARIFRDGAYQIADYVDKRWAPLSGRSAEKSLAAEQIFKWLESSGPRFVLVLGDFGTGKTFLLRALTHNLARHNSLIPVLVTMRDLEKGRSLDELLAQHMARYRPDEPFHASSFRYLLREGRVVLLLDGFDELAQRPTYERVKQHFEMLRQAAEGSAKIVMTSRHQHFATDSDVLNEVGRSARSLPGARVIRLTPLDDNQRRKLIEQSMAEQEADYFIRELSAIPNLLELTTNPRMLTFVMARRNALPRLAEATPADRPMNAGRLYETLLDDWLEHETSRQTAPGAADPLSVGHRAEALRDLAMRLWHTNRSSVPLEELGEVAESISELATWQVQAGEATHAVGSGTVLIRTEKDEFSFIHQSVLEYYVADALRMALHGTTRNEPDELLSNYTLSPLMAQFLCDLASEPSSAWAKRTAVRDMQLGPNAKANAALLLQQFRYGSLPQPANYSRQDLSGLDLSHIDLTNANLMHANLAGAVLPQSMKGSNLDQANLSGAEMVGANLAGASLRGTDLTGARMLGANLSEADLCGAIFDRAVLLGAVVDRHQLDEASTAGAALPQSKLSAQISQFSAAKAVAAFAHRQLVATGHEDGTIRRWDACTGRQLTTLQAHVGPVLALLAASDDSWLASAGDDGAVRIWNPASGTHLSELAGHSGPVQFLACPTDENWLASANRDSAINIWDPVHGALLGELDHNQGGVRSLTVASDGSWLAALDGKHTVRIWDPSSGELLGTLRCKNFSNPVVALATKPGRSSLIMSLQNGDIELRDPLNGRLEHNLTSAQKNVTQALAVSPNGDWLISFYESGSIRMWNLNTREVAEAAPYAPIIVSVAVGPAGDWIAAIDKGGAAFLWDPNTGTQSRMFQKSTAGIQALTVTSAEGLLAVADSDGTTRLWKPRWGTEPLMLHRRTTSVLALAVDPAGQWLAGAGTDSTITVWTMATGRVSRILNGHRDWVRALVADPSGRWLASAGDDGSVRFWDPNTGRCRDVLEPTRSWIHTLAVDPDGKWLACAGPDSEVIIWETRAFPLSRRPIRIISGGTRALTAIPGTEWLASASSEGTIDVWNIYAGSRIWELKGHISTANTLTASASGRWLASGGTDNTVRIWDLHTGRICHTLREHAGSINALAFGPSDDWLASGSSDDTVRIWSPQTGQLMETSVGDQNGWATLTPDGSFEVVGSPANLWWTAGLCRFDADEVHEIAKHLPHRRLLGRSRHV